MTSYSIALLSLVFACLRMPIGIIYNLYIIYNSGILSLTFMTVMHCVSQGSATEAFPGNGTIHCLGKPMIFTVRDPMPRNVVNWGGIPSTSWNNLIRARQGETRVKPSLTKVHHCLWRKWHNNLQGININKNNKENTKWKKMSLEELPKLEK